MPSTRCGQAESDHDLIRRGNDLRNFLNDPSHGYRLFVTLNSNAPTTSETARKHLAVWYNALNRKVYRKWSNRPDAARWQGWAFLEGFEREAAEEVTLHWHVLLGPGPGLGADKYADLMTSVEVGQPRLVEKHMAREWTRRYPGGSLESLYIRDLAGIVGYCTKDLRKYGPHLRRAHDHHTPLPLR